MDQAVQPLAQRLFDTLEALLRLPAGDLGATLASAADVIAEATGADKVDAFLYDPKRDSLVAVGTSLQALSMKQRQLGLDVLQLSNGGRAAWVYRTGKTFLTGALHEDGEELRGVKEGLAIKSKLGVPLGIGGERRGMMMLASLQEDFFTPEDALFLETAIRWIGIVAHRAELQEALGRAAAEQGRRAAAEELVTVVAHDLRNYIAPLHYRLQALRLRGEAAGRTEDAQDAAAALAAVDRLGSVVSEVLDAARIDQGLFRMQPQPVDLRALLEAAAAAWSTPQHPVQLRLEQGEAILLTADPARLRQCLDNILANAVQKSPAGSAVTVLALREAPEKAPRARVDVIDEGPGIAEELLPHIFERYATGRGREGGLGLGLYLAKRIAAVHGGDLTVESAPGRGARFILTLPCL